MASVTFAAAQGVFDHPLGVLLILTCAVLGVAGLVWLLVRMDSGLSSSTNKVPNNSRARLRDHNPESEEDTRGQN